MGGAGIILAGDLNLFSAEMHFQGTRKATKIHFGRKKKEKRNTALHGLIVSATGGLLHVGRKPKLDVFYRRRSITLESSPCRRSLSSHARLLQNQTQDSPLSITFQPLALSFSLFLLRFEYKKARYINTLFISFHFIMDQQLN